MITPLSAWRIFCWIVAVVFLVCLFTVGTSTPMSYKTAFEQPLLQYMSPIKRLGVVDLTVHSVNTSETLNVSVMNHHLRKVD